MPSRQKEKRDIRPTAPDATVQGLLALSLARVLPLAAGNRVDGYGCTGEYILTAAVQGSLTVSAYDRYALLDPGQAYLLESPGEHTVQAVSDGLCMQLHLQGELIPRLLEGRLYGGGALFAAGGAAVRETAMALAVLEDERGQVPAALASSLAYTMLMKLRSLPQREAEQLGSPLVEGALSIIQEEFPYLEGVEELAQRLEVSPAHLTRVFSKKTGVSPGKYITHVRVEYAKLLLSDPDTSITYVAEASGFANANYFAKVFRRETGMSPSEYLASIPAIPRPGPHISAYGP